MKFFLIAGVAFFMYACNNSNDEATTTVETDTTANSANVLYTPAEGDVSYRGGTVYVWRNNSWEAQNDDVRLDNGAVVHRDGHVEKDNDTIVLEDGEVVNKSGNFFDKAGNAIDKGWDKTKDAAKKTGKEIKKGANKVGEEVKDVFDGDDKKDNQ